MGFVILMIIVAYLLISAGVVSAAILYAQKHGKNPIRWGVSAALAMFLIPCWDWMPTVVAHKYYCEKEAGFWVYKSLNQWKAENPGEVIAIPPDKYLTGVRDIYGEHYLLPDGTEVMAKFDHKGRLMAHFKSKDGTSGYWLNQRFNLAVKQSPFIPLNYSIREEQQVVDSRTGEVLARYVDFSVSHERRQAGWVGWKMWLDNPYCVGNEVNKSKLWHFADDAENINILGAK